MLSGKTSVSLGLLYGAVTEHLDVRSFPMAMSVDVLGAEGGSGSEVLPPDAPAPLRDLLEHWQAIVVDRHPTAADFPFDTLVRTYPGLGSVEPAVSPEGRHDYCYRRLGPEHEKCIGRSYEGLLFSEVIAAPVVDRVIQTYVSIFATGDPHYAESINLIHGARPLTHARLLLPLFDLEGRVASLIGCWVWRDRPAD